MKRSAPLRRKVPLRANGGKARAEKLSPERRTEIARSAALARAAKVRAERGIEVGPGICAKCGAQHARVDAGRWQAYCRACANAAAAEWKRDNPLTGEAREKSNARSYANVYQRRGKLLPQPCEDCGSEDVEKHHDDYSKPLAVVYLCRACHLNRHKVEVPRETKPKPRATMAANLGAEPPRQAPKDGTFRCRTWREAVASLACAACGKPGPSQCAHINHRGKGAGLKAPDCWTFPLCPDCHREFDQGKSYTKDQRRETADGWVIDTIKELAQRGLVRA